MNAKKTIKKYIYGTKTDIITLTLLALGILLAFGAVLFGAILDDTDSIEKLSSSSEAGDYVYADVYEFDEIFCVRSDDECFFFGSRGNLSNMLFKGSKAEYGRLREQCEKDGSVRVYGKLSKRGSDLKDTLKENGYADLFHRNKDLLMRVTATPYSDASIFLIIFSVIMLLSSLVSFVASLRKRRYTKLCLERLDELDETKNAADELAASDMTEMKIIFTERFLFFRGTGVAVLLDDIAWMYSVRSITIMATKTFRNILPLPARDFRMSDELIKAVSERVPGMLTEYSEENEKIYRRKCPETRFIKV